MFDGIIIATNESHHDLRPLAQQLLKKLARTDCTIACFEAHPRLLFRTDAAEELIKIVYNSHLRSPHSPKDRFDFWNDWNSWNDWNNSLAWVPEVPIVPVVPSVSHSVGVNKLVLAFAKRLADS